MPLTNSTEPFVVEIFLAASTQSATWDISYYYSQSKTMKGCTRQSLMKSPSNKGIVGYLGMKREKKMHRHKMEQEWLCLGRSGKDSLETSMDHSPTKK